jgi:Family of unknown function (DUF5899)
MELAIPGVALGLLYVVSNQKKKNEAFTGRTQLPNVDVPNRNFPGEYPVVSSDTDQTSQLSTANRYDNGSGTYTDKYFNPNVNTTSMPGQPQYYSLTGDKVDASYFEHNNMAPYFGSRLRSQIADNNSNESILDNYSGAGSQSITKKEMAPLFSPHENLQWANGAPNASDFLQSRVNPSMRMANVKPFEEEIVGPGLGLGYTTQGAGGFNSGMMMRDSWLDKTADQLRVDNKPKATGLGLYGHEGPANSIIKTMATKDQMGIMEKRLPEQSFALDQRDFSNHNSKGSDDIGRLFTTTGAQRGETLRAVPVERFVNRPETAVSYSGVAGYQNPAAYVPGEYMPSHNQQLGEVPLMVANANGRFYANDADYGIKSKMAYPNNRTANKQDSYFGLVSGGLNAAIAPLLDVLRPSRKENVLGTLRPYQNPGTTVPESYIFNPADRPGPTIRETTENSKFHMNVNANQLGGAYQSTPVELKNTCRQETSDYYYAGNAESRTREPKSYEAGYNQRNNDIKASTINGYMVQGNMSLMNGDINMRQVSRDNMLKNERSVIGTMPYQSPDPVNMGRVAGNGNTLYSNIQMDRNTPDIHSALKSNPYVLDYRNML